MYIVEINMDLDLLFNQDKLNITGKTGRLWWLMNLIPVKLDIRFRYEDNTITQINKTDS